MNILYAPDFRESLPYQAYLSESLKKHDVSVEYLSHYRRGLPLYRGLSSASTPPDILHLHWPEAYFQSRYPLQNWIRKQRYLLDLYLATKKIPLVLTAHNLLPHNRETEPGVARNIAHTMRRARIVFAHSEEAKRQLQNQFGVDPSRCEVIPYGDHAVNMLPPCDPSEARLALNLPEHETICIMFGTVSPYKGILECVKYWKKNQLEAATLYIVGPVTNNAYAEKIRSAAEGQKNIQLRISKSWLGEAELRQWLSAADCALFNYKEIFTSGAAALARSFGLPLLIPERLKCADLMEPHSHVFRFESLDKDFFKQLMKVLEIKPSYTSAEDWRQHTSWENVARLTAEAYNRWMVDGSRWEESYRP